MAIVIGAAPGPDIPTRLLRTALSDQDFADFVGFCLERYPTIQDGEDGIGNPTFRPRTPNEALTAFGEGLIAGTLNGIREFRERREAAAAVANISAPVAEPVEVVEIEL